MNRIDQSLTDQLFSTKASSRLTDAENSVKSEYATSLFSQKESGSRENTFTSAFNQERRAVRSSASEEPKEDRQTNSAEKEKTGAVVTRKKTRKPNSSKTSSGVELDGESDWAPLSEEDSEPDQAKKAREGGLDPMWLALVNSEALTMVEPLAEGGAFQLERLLWNESGEKARAQALGLSVWIQLSEGKSVSVTTVDTQPLSTELIQAAPQIAEGGEGERASTFGDQLALDTLDPLAPSVLGKVETADPSVIANVGDPHEKPLKIEEPKTTPSNPQPDPGPSLEGSLHGKTVASDTADTLQSVWNGGKDPLPETTELADSPQNLKNTPDRRVVDGSKLGDAELALTKGAYVIREAGLDDPKPEGSTRPLESEATVNTGSKITAALAETLREAQNATNTTLPVQEEVAGSSVTKAFNPTERSTVAVQTQKPVNNPPLRAAKDINTNEKGPSLLPEKMGYPANANSKEEEGQRQPGVSESSGALRKTAKYVPNPNLSNPAVKQSNTPTLWDRYQEIFFEKDIQKVRLDSFTVKVFQKPAPPTEVTFDSAKPLERREGQQVTSGLKSVENPVFRMPTPIKASAYQDIGAVRGQDIQATLSGIEEMKASRSLAWEGSETSQLKVPQQTDDSTKTLGLAQVPAKYNGSKEDQGDSQAMHQQSDGTWRAQGWGSKEVSLTKDWEANLREIAQRIKDLASISSSRMRTVESAVIRLNPPELGRMVVEVVKEGNSVVVLLKVETQEAKEMLEKNAHLLTQRLAQSGFEAQKVQVMMEKYEEQGQGRQDAQQERGSEQDQSRKEQETPKENDTEEPVYQSFAELLAGV